MVSHIDDDGRIWRQKGIEFIFLNCGLRQEIMQITAVLVAKDDIVGGRDQANDGQRYAVLGPISLLECQLHIGVNHAPLERLHLDCEEHEVILGLDDASSVLFQPLEILVVVLNVACNVLVPFSHYKVHPLIVQG